MEPVDLIKRLAKSEDSYVERKPEGGDFEPTIVAFANSVPPDREAILFIGVHDNGEVVGVRNTDSLQKKIKRICVEKCYPPIYFTSEVVAVGEKSVLAVIIPASPRRPHFAGPAYIRRGSESIVASEELYRDLIASRVEKAGELLKYKNTRVSVSTNKTTLGRPEFTSVQMLGRSYECNILEVTPFYVTFLDIQTSRRITEPMRNIEISYDDARNRPMLLIRSDGA